MRPVIALDLDEVLVDCRVVPETLREFGIYTVHGLSWDLRELPENIRQEIFARFRDPSRVCRDGVAIHGAAALLKRWHVLGYRLAVITSRNPDIGAETEAFVRRNFPEVDAVHVVGAEPKIKTLASLAPVLFVDDNPSNVAEASSAGIRSVLVSHRLTPYNHAFAETYEGPVVSSILEIDIRKLAR